MASIHHTMLKHVDQAHQIMEWRKSGKLAEMRGELSKEARMAEEFLFGLLDGMSFKESMTCYGGLVNVVYQGFEALNYRQVYAPWNTLKFTIATEKLAEASNTVYA